MHEGKLLWRKVVCVRKGIRLLENGFKTDICEIKWQHIHYVVLEHLCGQKMLVEFEPERNASKTQFCGWADM